MNKVKIKNPNLLQLEHAEWFDDGEEWVFYTSPYESKAISSGSINKFDEEQYIVGRCACNLCKSHLRYKIPFPFYSSKKKIMG